MPLGTIIIVTLYRLFQRHIQTLDWKNLLSHLKSYSTWWGSPHHHNLWKSLLWTATMNWIKNSIAVIEWPHNCCNMNCGTVVIVCLPSLLKQVWGSLFWQPVRLFTENFAELMLKDTNHRRPSDQSIDKVDPFLIVVKSSYVITQIQIYRFWRKLHELY